jgi:hypothetical protein
MSQVNINSLSAFKKGNRWRAYTRRRGSGPFRQVRTETLSRKRDDIPVVAVSGMLFTTDLLKKIQVALSPSCAVLLIDADRPASWRQVFGVSGANRS